jgi:hypothetical protein
MPALTPEQQAESNFPRILAISSVFNVAAITSIVVRLYTRIVIVKSASRDDLVMVLAGLGALGGLICFALQGEHGLGRHFQAIAPDDFSELLKLNFVQSVVSHIVALGLLKISLSLSLLRLSRSRWYTWSLWALIVFVTCYTVMACFTLFFHCDRIEGNWSPSPEIKCYSIELFIEFGVTNTAFNIATDIASATLPIPIIWGLKMKRRTRIYLVGILSLGYLAVAAGVVKAVHQLNFSGFGVEMDLQFEQQVQVWGFLQLNLAIIAACVPTLKPLLGHTLQNSSTGKNCCEDYGIYSRNTSSRRAQYTATDDDQYQPDSEGFTGLEAENQSQTVISSLPRWTEAANNSTLEGLPGQGTHVYGIVRTTEISVER